MNEQKRKRAREQSESEASTSTTSREDGPQPASTSTTSRAKVNEQKRKNVDRNPPISIYGRVDISDSLNTLPWLLYPTTVTNNITQQNYTLNWRQRDPLCALNEEQLASKEMLEFKKSAKELLDKPLGSLSWNEKRERWKCNELAGPEMSVIEDQIIEGFTYGMANQRGRGSISRILTALLEGGSRAVLNIGGSNYHNEPARREVHFFPTLQDNGSSNSSSSRFFVPDIILEEKANSNKSELLVVEVKKGQLLTTQHEVQLKYLLLPSAIKQGQVLGLLICAKEAMIMKYTVTSDNDLNFQISEHPFRIGSLSDDIVEVICILKHHLDNL